MDRSRGKRWLLLGCLSLVVLGVIAVIWMGALIASTPESGVKVASNMDQYAIDYLEQHDMLEAGERVVAYYDATLGMDGTEAAILTTLAIKYHQGGSTMSIPISKIEDVHLRANVGILVGSTVVFALSLWLVRSQAMVEDVSWMKAMIPHHSTAILTSERVHITDPHVRELADGIIKAQRWEIGEIKALIEDLESRR